MSSYGGLQDLRQHRVSYINPYLHYIDVDLRVGDIVGTANAVSSAWYEGLRSIDDTLSWQQQVRARARLVEDLIIRGLVTDRMRDQLLRVFS